MSWVIKHCYIFVVYIVQASAYSTMYLPCLYRLCFCEPLWLAQLNRVFFIKNILKNHRAWESENIKKVRKFERTRDIALIDPPQFDCHLTHGFWQLNSTQYCMVTNYPGRVRIDGGWGLTHSSQSPCSFHCAPPPNSLVPAVLLTLPVHFSQFEHCTQEF